MIIYLEKTSLMIDVKNIVSLRDGPGYAPRLVLTKDGLKFTFDLNRMDVPFLKSVWGQSQSYCPTKGQ